jgi:hypothetical protein
MMVLRDAIPVVRRGTDGHLDRWVQFQREDPAGDSMPFADQPTSILNKWDTYTYRTTIDYLEELPAERFTDDRFALIEALNESQN